MLPLLLALTIATDDPAPKAAEAVPAELEAARKLVAAQAENRSGLINRALQTINRVGDKSDIRLLMTLRGDKRPTTLEDDRAPHEPVSARVSEAAAAIALRLAGQNVKDFGFIEEVVATTTPGVKAHVFSFRNAAAREEAARKAWAWLDHDGIGNRPKSR